MFMKLNVCLDVKIALKIFFDNLKNDAENIEYFYIRETGEKDLILQYNINADGTNRMIAENKLNLSFILHQVKMSKQTLFSNYVILNSKNEVILSDSDIFHREINNSNSILIMPFNKYSEAHILCFFK